MAPIQGLFQEAVIWKRLRHRNVVYFHGVEWHLFHPRLTLVSDWMPNGRITDYLQTNLRANRIKLILNIAEGLEYLHVEGFVHGDVKGANILVDEEHVARLADFGLADLYYTSRIGSKSVPVGSTRWAAPEVLDPEHFERESVETSPQADIYAFAMVIWEVFTGRLPFFHFKRDATVIHNVLKGKRPPRPVQAIPLGLSDNVWTLMEACWDEDHQTRPHISDIANTLRDELTRRPIDVEDQVPAEWPLVIQHNLLDDILMTQSVGAKIESHSAICLSR
ncbi:hypothetical protein CERSUDRAFT_42259 [Gelatoporia subvermispora B]|uniref:Protein kinase domain-containing protein n=1 Tax=Ceriporiopsis subvermispora (strain B) TaxID=914234 RepID=M2PWW8_CERS8|nr:hypothetical protein CERSUDRAFT_42259 [Gelatoporia subvermispora B]